MGCLVGWWDVWVIGGLFVGGLFGLFVGCLVGLWVVWLSTFQRIRVGSLS